MENFKTKFAKRFIFAAFLATLISSSVYYYSYYYYSQYENILMYLSFLSGFLYAFLTVKILIVEFGKDKESNKKIMSSWYRNAGFSFVVSLFLFMIIEFIRVPFGGWGG